MKKHEALKYVLHHFILNILAFSLFISVFLGLAAIVRFSEVTIPTYMYIILLTSTSLCLTLSLSIVGEALFKKSSPKEKWKWWCIYVTGGLLLFFLVLLVLKGM